MTKNVNFIIVFGILGVLLYPNIFSINFDISIPSYWFIYAIVGVSFFLLSIYLSDIIEVKNLLYKEVTPDELGVKKKELKKGNFAYAKFQTDFEEKSYAAHSKIKLFNKKIIKTSKGDVNVCYSTNLVEKHCPVKRLTSDLKFQIPDEERYAAKKKDCCERKIVAQIMEDNLEKDYKGSKLIIYTRLEPCIYCFNALGELSEKGVSISLFYDDMLIACSELKPIIEELTKIDNAFA